MDICLWALTPSRPRISAAGQPGEVGGVVLPGSFLGIGPMVDWNPSYGFTNSWGPDENGTSNGPGIMYAVNQLPHQHDHRAGNRSEQI